VIEVRHTSIEERLAARRDMALARSFTARMSTLAGRPPVCAPGERGSKVRTLAVALLAMALAALLIVVSGVAQTSAFRVELAAITPDEGSTEGFAVGIRVEATGDRELPEATALTAALKAALEERIAHFEAVEIAPGDEDGAAFIFVAYFSEQTALQLIAAVITEAFDELGGAEVIIGASQDSPLADSGDEDLLSE